MNQMARHNLKLKFMEDNKSKSNYAIKDESGVGRAHTEKRRLRSGEGGGREESFGLESSVQQRKTKIRMEEKSQKSPKEE